MNIQVTVDEVKVSTIPQIHKGEYNVHKLNFTYSSEYNGLVKTAIFEDGDNSIEVQIINDWCYIPNEILDSRYDSFVLRVYGYEVVGTELKIRYSPAYTTIPKVEGSYKKGNTQSEKVTPTQFEQYSKALASGLKELNDMETDLQDKVDSGYFTGPAGPAGPAGPRGPQGNNGTNGIDGFSPIATVSKVGTTATITITDAVGTTIATVSDGTTPSLTDYVKNTDYASYATAGVVKCESNAFRVNSSGWPFADTINYADYPSKTNAHFISKGTLENVFTGKDIYGNTYSTSEVAVGKWIDGKIIYRRCADISAITSSNSNIVDISSWNIDNIISLKGFIKDSSGNINIVPMYDSSSNYNVLFYNGTYLRGRCAIGSGGTISSAYAIVEYTKSS